MMHSTDRTHGLLVLGSWLWFGGLVCLLVVLVAAGVHVR
jgi:hypothetical protein